MEKYRNEREKLMLRGLVLSSQEKVLQTQKREHENKIWKHQNLYRIPNTGETEQFGDALAT
jgi:hypothetical protein